MSIDSGYTLSFGAEGVLNLVFLMIGIVVSWYALGTIRWTVFLKHPASGASRLLRLIVAIILGNQLASFFMQYVHATILLQHW